VPARSPCSPCPGVDSQAPGPRVFRFERPDATVQRNAGHRRDQEGLSDGNRMPLGLTIILFVPTALLIKDFLASWISPDFARQTGWVGFVIARVASSGEDSCPTKPCTGGLGNLSTTSWSWSSVHRRSDRRSPADTRLRAARGRIRLLHLPIWGVASIALPGNASSGWKDGPNHSGLWQAPPRRIRMPWHPLSNHAFFRGLQRMGEPVCQGVDCSSHNSRSAGRVLSEVHARPSAHSESHSLK